MFTTRETLDDEIESVLLLVCYKNISELTIEVKLKSTLKYDLGTSDTGSRNERMIG